MRLVSSTSRAPDRDRGALDPVAEVRGINVHARQRVHGRDRAGIERLGRYVTAAVASLPSYPGGFEGRGVVIPGGGPKYFPCGPFLNELGVVQRG